MNLLRWFNDCSLKTQARWLQFLTLLLGGGIITLYWQMKSSNETLERNTVLLERQLSADSQQDSTLYQLGVGEWSWGSGLDEENGPVLHLGEGLIKLFDLDKNNLPKTLNEFLALIRDDDRAWFTKLISDKQQIGRTYNVVVHLANGRIVRVNGSVIRRLDAPEPVLLGSCLPATDLEYRTSLQTIPQRMLQ